jgi:hypothetical protein
MIEQEVLGRNNNLLSFNTTRTARKTIISSCVFIAEGNMFTESLSSNVGRFSGIRGDAQTKQTAT